MIARFSRLLRRSADVYLETGSRTLAVRFLCHVTATKFVSLLQRLWAFRHVVLPWRVVAEARRVEAIRADSRLMIAIVVSGGLGDLIVIARCLRDLQAKIEPFSFDVFAPLPALAQWVFAAVPGFERAFSDTLEASLRRSYDALLRMNQTIVVQHQATRWARVRREPLTVATFGLINRRRKEIELYIHHHPHLDNGLGRFAVYRSRSRRDFLHHMAGLQYAGDELDIASDSEIVARCGLEGRRFVTIHNGFDTSFVIAGRRATKCYPHFPGVVAGIKASRPDVLIVQIGTATSEPIAGVDLDLVGQTSLSEVAGLLRATSLHIDNEGGLVHLAACYGRRSLVVFGPTPADYFGYPDNINVTPQHCGGCWWIDELWMDRCPRGLPEPECMFTQPPENIVYLALEALGPRTSLDRAGAQLINSPVNSGAAG